MSSNLSFLYEHSQKELDETYQEIKGVRYDFDDMKIVKELLIELGK